MEDEMMAEVNEYSTASLHLDETDNALKIKEEFLKASESSVHELNKSGQIIPSQDTDGGCKAETEDSFNPVGSSTVEENIDIHPQVNSTSAEISNHETQSITHQEKDRKITSILKRDENRPKKSVQFRENIVSVKFYDLSEDDDSDDDTVILSDPEEDDVLREQEVPFNTHDDYTSCSHSSFSSVRFIPQFSFPPVLKISNYQLCDKTDDEEEQIMAIMDDDDGRESTHVANVHARTSVCLQEESPSLYQESRSTHTEGKRLFFQLEEPGDRIKMKSEQAEDFVEVKAELSHLVDVSDFTTDTTDLEENINKSLEDHVMATIDVTTLPENLDEPLKFGEIQSVLPVEGCKDDLEDNMDNMEVPVKVEDERSVEKENVDSEEAITVRNETPVLMVNSTTAFDEKDKKDDFVETTPAEVTNSSPVDTTNVALGKESVLEYKKEMNEEGMSEGTAEYVATAADPESKETFGSRFVIKPTSRNCSTRTVHGYCGSSLLRRGQRIIDSLMVEENFQVPPSLTVDENILHRSFLTKVIKEEITIPGVEMVDVSSQESRFHTIVWNKSAVTKHEESQLEKYVVHPSSPEHLTEFEKVAVKTDFPSNTQTQENDSYNRKLRFATTFEKEDILRSKECDTVVSNEETDEDHEQHLRPQIVPDLGRCLKAQSAVIMAQSSRAVPSGMDDMMDSTETSLHIDERLPADHEVLNMDDKTSLTNTSVFETTSGSSHSRTPFLAKQGRRRLRVGLSRSTRIKPLHPYWSKERIR